MDAVIFDLDGTLVDSLPDIAASANTALAQFEKPALTLDTIRGFIGNGVPHLAELVRERAGLDAGLKAEFLKAVLTAYDLDPFTQTRPYSGVMDALDRLKSDGVKMAVCTNKVEDVSHKVIAGMGMSGYFDAIVGGDTLSVRKPDAEPLMHTARLIGVNKFVYIGDSEVDEATALNANVPFGFYTEGYAHVPIETAAFRFSDFGDLVQLIGKMA